MWYDKYLEVYEHPVSDVRQEIFDIVRSNITRLQSEKPVVTISVIAYNEERHLLACLWSLSDTLSKYPVEIIGVDNESKDRTAEIFEKCGVPYYTETQHSCGFARQCGLNHARGKYHLNIDSDTMYPPKYVEIMVEALSKENVVGASSLWSYIPDKEHSKFAITIYEFCRDTYLWLQHFKRPELSVRGLVFGYNTELAKKVGIRTDIIRGEDGSLALGLKEFGKISFLHNKKARPVTGYGTVGQDGSFGKSFWVRIRMQLKGSGRWLCKSDYYPDKEDNLINKRR